MGLFSFSWWPKLLEIALKNKKVLEYLLEMPPISLIYNRYVGLVLNFY